MSGPSVTDSKVSLYLALLKEHPDNLSDADIELMSLLASDPNIQLILDDK